MYKDFIRRFVHSLYFMNLIKIFFVTIKDDFLEYYLVFSLVKRNNNTNILKSSAVVKKTAVGVFLFSHIYYAHNFDVDSL